MEGNTWKTQNIPQTGLSRSSKLRVAIKVPLKGELQGIGIGDGSHQLLYITQGTQYGWNDAWVNYRYFNTLPANQWNYYEIPIGEDWYNKYGYYPVIGKIHYINDNDACNGIVLFDAISIESEGGVVYFDDVSVVKKNYVEVEGGERVYYYHNDHLGTPQVMTDITGNIVWKADYEPFGKVNIVVENIENNIRFPGQYYISETGLYYNWWRWYKSEIGRYMEPDPYRITSISKELEFKIDLGIIKNTHRYIYSLNNPINLSDIFGLESDKELQCSCPGEDIFVCTKFMKGDCKKCECTCFCEDEKGKTHKFKGKCWCEYDGTPISCK